MQLLINNSPVAFKAGSSFEYVSENRLFSNSDDYSLSISLPLAGCEVNQRIFGFINRPDIDPENLHFDAELVDVNFHKFGCVAIVEISESEIKVQFLEGRSAANFQKTLDRAYINELDLGQPAALCERHPEMRWVGNDYVFLPWVNNASGNMQNEAKVDWLTYEWAESDPTYKLSAQPFLRFLISKICDAVGYECAMSESVEAWMKDILVCNTLPAAWGLPQFARALPHWSVEEFFAKLELFMGAEIDIDNHSKKISFRMSGEIAAETPQIRLDEVTEDLTKQVEADPEQANCDYLECRNFCFSDCDHRMWKYYSCRWFVERFSDSIERYDRMADLLSQNKSLATWNGSGHRNHTVLGKILYAADVDQHFIIRTIHREEAESGNLYNYRCVLQPVNSFGPKIADDRDDAKSEDLDFVPAWIDYCQGLIKCLYLQVAEYNEAENAAPDDSDNTHDDATDRDPDEWIYTASDKKLCDGDKEQKPEYFDKIYLGIFNKNMVPVPKAGGKGLPFPHVESVEILNDWSGFSRFNTPFRINSEVNSSSALSSTTVDIDKSVKKTFSFLADRLPDVRSVFLIRGKRYLCEKLTATFTEHGMSRKIKGTFWQIKP